MEPLSKIVDVLFNGRSATPERRSTVTLENLVERKVSMVLLNGKLYRVQVDEVDAKKFRKEGSAA